MEIFLDGGLFELLVVLVFGYGLNYIFRQKYLLVLFSFLIVAAPVLLLFLHKGDLLYILVAVCILNALLLVLVLWRLRKQSTRPFLFDTDKYRRLLSDKFFKHSIKS
jgi:hypothetical protein